MTKLSKTKQDTAANFIQRHARPLEQTLYHYHFESGNIEDVLAELARFQNDDGGFGHGLEPDVGLPDSSVIATTIAFQRFREVNAPADAPIVQKASRYLLDTFDQQHQIWQIIPPNVGDAPHAPWWTYHGKPEELRDNPRAEIVGYLHAYPDLFPADLRDALTQATLNHLAAASDPQGGMEMHALQCYVRLVETDNLPRAVFDALMEKLVTVASTTVTVNPAEWGAYSLTPLTIVSGPDSPFYAQFGDSLVANLGFEMQSQSEEGYWTPAWSWADVSEEGWRQAEQDWRGVLTLANLVRFKRFGYLEV